MRRLRAVVVGGGIAGLATAALLARDGYSVTVLEKNAQLGGRVGEWEQRGFRFDTGPSWYLMPEVFDHFFQLLGTSAQRELDLVRLDPAYRVFFEHAPSLDIAADPEETIKQFETIEPGAGRALSDYLHSAGDTADLALRRFLYTNFTSLRSVAVGEVVTRVPTLVRLLLQPLDRYVARRFRDSRLQQILGYPAVLLGSSPTLTPALYHLMSHFDLNEGVWYPQGGFTEIITSIAELAREAGATIVHNAEVTAIVPQRRGAGHRVRGVTYRDHNGALRGVSADIVVSAADLHHTETQLVPRALQSYPDQWWSKRRSGPGAVLVYLGVRGALSELEHHSLFFTADWADNFSRIFDEPTSIPSPASLYVCRASGTDPTAAPGSDESLFVLVPVPADTTIGRGGIDGGGDACVERVADDAVRMIADWAEVPDLTERIVTRRTVGPGDFARDLNSWSGGALGPAHTLRQSAFLRGKNVSSSLDGLYYAGATTVPGVGLPMCLISAELVLKRLRGDTSAGPLAAPL